MKSMTAYARGESLWEDITFVAEIRTVNHRYRDIVVKLPQRLFLLEDRIKRLIAQYIHRGRVDCNIKINGNSEPLAIVTINWDVAKAYKRLLEELKEGLSLKDDITLDMFLGLKDLFTTEETDIDLEKIWPSLEALLKEVLEQINLMREKEGENLKADLKKRLEYIKEMVNQIEAEAPKVIECYRQRLRQKVSELLEKEVDEDRLAQEVVIFAERSDITEEVVRLKSHLKQFSELIDTATGPIGRKLDFLLQEMHREANTLGVKANSSSISHLVVEIKSELEKMRQQVQNIE